VLQAFGLCNVECFAGSAHASHQRADHTYNVEYLGSNMYIYSVQGGSSLKTVDTSCQSGTDYGSLHNPNTYRDIETYLPIASS
jgi:hypothetical protein